MIRNEIGCYNRWGRYAFRWRTYRGMHHWIEHLKLNNCWDGYDMEHNYYKLYYKTFGHVKCSRC